MKQLYLTLLSFVLFSSISIAQTAGVKGFLADSASKAPVDYATVAVFNLNDSSIITFALTDPKGGFELSRLPLHTPLRLFVSHVLYGSLRINMRFESDTIRDMDTLYLVENTALLEEAVISWEQPPILIRNDTVEFNADAFINRPGSMVEDLLKRIPGVEFSEDGKVTVNGKEVSKITLDSKDFFSEDPVILLKNLPAKAIQTVQVSEEKDERGKPTNSGKVTINLKLKSWAKTGHFGKAYAGYGTDERYEAGGIWNFFRDTLQVSVLAYGNNLSNAGFSYSDLMQLGGFNRSGSNRTVYYSDGRVEMDGVSVGGGQGITESAGAGVNINYDIPQKLKISGSYFFGYTNTNYWQNSLSTINMTDSSLLRESMFTSDNTTYSHNLQSKLTWTPDTIHRFRYTPAFSISSSSGDARRDNFTSYTSQTGQNSILNDLGDKSGNNSYSGALSWNGKWNKWTHDVYQYHSFNEGNLNGFNQIRQDFADTNLALFSSRQVRSNETNSTQLRQGYEASLAFNDSVTLDMGISANLDNSTQNTLIHQTDSNGIPQYVLLPSLSTQFEMQKREYSSSFYLMYGLKKGWEFRAGLDIGLLDLQLSNQLSNAFTRKEFLLLPAELELYKRSPLGSWSISLSYEPEVPQNWDLLDVTDNRNPNVLRIGNPNLDVSNDYSISSSYYGAIGKSGINVWSHISYTLNQNQIISRSSVNESGVQEIRPENLPSDKVQHGSFSYVSLSKRMKSKDWSHLISLSGNYWMSIGYTAFNTSLYNQENYNVNANLSYTLEKKGKLDMRVRYERGYGKANVLELNSNNNRNSDRLKWDLWWAITEKNWFEFKYTYNIQRTLNSSSIPQQFSLLNVSFTRLILKENKGQLRLSVFDALGQNTNVSRWVYLNNTNESQSNVVTRYVMLSFIYNLHQFKTEGRSKRGFEFF